MFAFKPNVVLVNGLGAEGSEPDQLLLGALLELLHHLAPLQLEVVAHLLSVPLRFQILGLRFKCSGAAEALARHFVVQRRFVLGIIA